MWSGPRNLSTAMMYAFGARGDCAVVDEPFYAAYLAKTGIDHPMRDAIMASQSQDAAEVAQGLIGPIPGGHPHYYQKHMTQHMIPGAPRDWMAEVVNVFLIRHPARVVASYAKKREAPVLDDIGFRQQAELFEHVKSLGQTPVVIDSGEDPTQGALRLPPPGNGTRIRFVDIPPDTQELINEGEKRVAEAFDQVGDRSASTVKKNSPHPLMHRTETVDYGIVIEGEIVLVLDDSEVELKTGNVVIQRGTNHAWANRSGKPCRMLFILVDGQYGSELAEALGQC